MDIHYISVKMVSISMFPSSFRSNFMSLKSSFTRLRSARPPAKKIGRWPVKSSRQKIQILGAKTEEWRFPRRNGKPVQIAAVWRFSYSSSLRPYCDRFSRLFRLHISTAGWQVLHNEKQVNWARTDRYGNQGGKKDTFFFSPSNEN